MIAHILPLLIATAGIGTNARALPVAQGVTALLSPGAAPEQCKMSAPSTYGISIAPVAVAAPLRKRQDVTQIADGQVQAPSNAGSAAGIASADLESADAVSATPSQAFNAGAAAAQAGQEGVSPYEVASNTAANVANGVIPQTPQQFGASTASSIDTDFTAGSGSVAQIPDGQIQAPGTGNNEGLSTPAGPSAPGVASVAEVPSAPSAPSASTPGQVAQIGDGQIQAPQGPVPSATTAGISSVAEAPSTPEVPVAPAAVSIAEAPSIPEVPSAGALGQVTQIGDGQIQAPQGPASGATTAGISSVAEAPLAPQAPSALEVPSVPGAASIAEAPSAGTPGQVAQIGDGQIQALQAPASDAATAGISNISVAEAPSVAGAPSAAVAASAPEALSALEAPSVGIAGQVTQIGDGQIQAPQGPASGAATAGISNSPSSSISSASLGEVGTASATPSEAANAGAAAAEAGQQGVPPAQVGQEAAEYAAEGEVPQSPASLGASSVSSTGTGTVTQIGDGQVQARKVKRSILKVRQNGDPVVISLNNGILTDSLGRTGYIADNRQLQFDAPPQGGAIYTAGFSACDDGTIALGGSNTFYACGSSDFNNLYDQAIYPDNCSPVNLLLN